MVFIATIYNFRIRLKNEGAPVASKQRGLTLTAEEIAIESKKAPQTDFQELQGSDKMETYNFTIDRVAVIVSGKAKNC